MVALTVLSSSGRNAAKGDDNPHADIIEALKTALGIRKRVEEVAAMAAPYCHPRQGNALDEPAGESRDVAALTSMALISRARARQGPRRWRRELDPMGRG